MEMISIKGLKRRIKEKFCNSCSTPYKDTDVIEMGEYCCDMVSDTMAFVDELPTIEAEPVKRGRWIVSETQRHVEVTYECSECQHEVVGEYEKTLFCGGCGARMDGDEPLKGE